MTWTPENIEKLIALYPDNSNIEIAKILSTSVAAVNGRAFKLKLFKTKEFHRERASKTWFPKGHIPQSKGKKWSEFMSEKGQEGSRKTTFKKGNIPKNHKPVGTEVIEPKNGYIKIKVAEPSKWMLKHRYIWEQTNGKIPKGYNVQFANKDRPDYRIENLYLISRSEQINNNSIIRYPNELRKAIFRVSKIKKLINQNENNNRRS